MHDCLIEELVGQASVPYYIGKHLDFNRANSTSSDALRPILPDSVKSLVKIPFIYSVWDFEDERAFQVNTKYLLEDIQLIVSTETVTLAQVFLYLGPNRMQVYSYCVHIRNKV